MPEGKRAKATRKAAAKKRRPTKKKAPAKEPATKKRQRTQAEIFPEIPANLYAALRLGATRTVACSHAGVTTQTFRNWEKRAEEGEEFFVDLFQKIEDAENQLQLRCLQAIHNAMPTKTTEKVTLKNGKEVTRPVAYSVLNASAQNAKWLLNNKFNDFKPKSVVEHKVDEDSALAGRSEEELQHYIDFGHFPDEAPE